MRFQITCLSSPSPLSLKKNPHMHILHAKSLIGTSGTNKIATDCNEAAWEKGNQVFDRKNVIPQCSEIHFIHYFAAASVSLLKEVSDCWGTLLVCC